MTKASRDTQARRKEKERTEKKKEREREREGEREEERGKKRKWTGVPSHEQSSSDTPGRGLNLSVTFRNTPKGKEGREGG